MLTNVETVSATIYTERHLYLFSTSFINLFNFDSHCKVFFGKSEFKSKYMTCFWSRSCVICTAFNFWLLFVLLCITYFSLKVAEESDCYGLPRKDAMSLTTLEYWSSLSLLFLWTHFPETELRTELSTLVSHFICSWFFTYFSVSSQFGNQVPMFVGSSVLTDCSMLTQSRFSNQKFANQMVNFFSAMLKFK